MPAAAAPGTYEMLRPGPVFRADTETRSLRGCFLAGPGLIGSSRSFFTHGLAEATDGRCRASWIRCVVRLAGRLLGADLEDAPFSTGEGRQPQPWWPRE